MNHCGSCYHCDQTGSRGWLRQCSKLKDEVLITGDDSEQCPHYKDLYSKNLFGDTLYHELIVSKKIIDGTCVSPTIDKRFKQ
jgi:hypothetical protein